MRIAKLLSSLSAEEVLPRASTQAATGPISPHESAADVYTHASDTVYKRRRSAAVNGAWASTYVVEDEGAHAQARDAHSSGLPHAVVPESVFEDAEMVFNPLAPASVPEPQDLVRAVCPPTWLTCTRDTRQDWCSDARYSGGYTATFACRRASRTKRSRTMRPHSLIGRDSSRT